MESHPGDIGIKEDLTAEHEFCEISWLDAFSCMIFELYSRILQKFNCLFATLVFTFKQKVLGKHIRYRRCSLDMSTAVAFGFVFSFLLMDLLSNINLFVCYSLLKAKLN